MNYSEKLEKKAVNARFVTEQAMVPRSPRALRAGCPVGAGAEHCRAPCARHPEARTRVWPAVLRLQGLELACDEQQEDHSGGPRNAPNS